MATSKLDDIIKIIRKSLADSKSKLSDFSTGSNLYLLTRSFAVVMAEKEQDLENAILNTNITTATGSALDLLAADFNIFRKAGTYAEGYILISSNKNSPQVIPAQTIITAAGNLDYILQEKTVVSNVLSSPVKIKATVKGETYNLPAGTNVAVKGFEGLTAVIGFSRNPITRAITGGLVRGSLAETDANFKKRIQQRIVNIGKSSLESVRQAALAVEGISGVLIKEQQPQPGYFTVYIDVVGSGEASVDVLEEVKRAIEKYRPIGVAYFVKSLNKQSVDIDINIKTNEFLNRAKLYEQIETFTFNYIKSLEIGEELNSKKLEASLYQFREVYEATVISNIQIRIVNSKVILNNLKISIENSNDS
jgi:uncharacterized phage protein gp47/JayE